MKKEKKNICRIFLENLKKAKFYIIAVVFIFTIAGRVLAMKRLSDSMGFYMKGRYISAQRKLEEYLEERPDDKLAIDMYDMVTMTLCSIHLKKAFSLLSEGVNDMANNELEKAAKYHAGYSKKIEERYFSYLKLHNKVKSANKLIYELLTEPQPTSVVVYDLSRRLRRRQATVVSRAERARLKNLKTKLAKIKSKKKWDEALDLIAVYMMDNPDSIDAKVMLNEVNRIASEEFYMQAVDYLEKAKMEKGKKMAATSKEYDAEWFDKKINTGIEEVRVSIAMRADEKAKDQLKVLAHLDPEHPDPPLYLRLFKIDEEGFFNDTVLLYDVGKYNEAAVRFDFFSLREPDNSDAKLYYHLASARRFILDIKLEEVKNHLIRALEISPDEREAVDIFSRLQDVLEVMSGR